MPGAVTARRRAWWQQARALATGDDGERLALLRVLVTGYAVAYLVIRAPQLWDLAALADTAPGRWDPVGPFTLVDQPWPAWAVRALIPATIVAGVLAALGRAWALTAPATAIGVLLLTSYESSWGQILHTENLLVLHLIVLAVAAVVDGGTGARRTQDLAPRVMVVIVVVAYVLAGWAKLRVSGWHWVSGDALLHHVAHDGLRKELVGSWSSPIGAWAVGHPWVFPPIAALSLLVELAAPLALLGGRIRDLWVAGAWLFHLGVLVVMAILFPYQLTLVAFAPLFVARVLRPSCPSR